MQDFLSSLDVVNQAFKKAFHGYDANEVDEFLDRVADTLQRLTQENKSLNDALTAKDKELSEYKNMKNTLQNAILLAQKSAEDRVNSAREQAQGIVRDAQAQAEEIKREAIEENDKLRSELVQIRATRDKYISEFRAVLKDYDSQLDRIMSSRHTAAVDALCSEPKEEAEAPAEEAPQQDSDAANLEAACGMLGIDPKFFNAKK